jgi:hypothetical protein
MINSIDKFKMYREFTHLVNSKVELMLACNEERQQFRTL